MFVGFKQTSKCAITKLKPFIFARNYNTKCYSNIQSRNFYTSQICFSSFQKLFDSGCELFSKNEYSKAIDVFSQALSLDSNSVDAYVQRGRAYFYNKQFDKAIQDLTKALEMDSKNVDALTFRASAYVFKRNFQQALNDFTDALKYNETKELYMKRGGTHLTTGNLDDALKDLTKALEIDPMYVDALIIRGNLYTSLFMKQDFKIKNIRLALADFSLAHKLQPDSLDALAGAVISHSILKHYDECIDLCNIALKLEPNAAKWYYWRGNAYFEKKEYDKALEDLNQSISLDPNNIEAYRRRAAVHEELGNFDEADKDEDTVRKLNALNP